MIATYKGTIEQGVVRLMDNVQLPEHIIVYVVVPDLSIETEQSTLTTAHVRTPHLRHRAQLADFTMEVTEELSNGTV